MKAIKFKKLLIGISTACALTLQACGSDDFGEIKNFQDNDGITNGIVTIESGSIFITEGFDQESLPEGITGNFLLSSSKISTENDTEVADGDVAGFAMESLAHSLSIADLIAAYRQALSTALGGLDSVSTITQTQSEDGSQAEAIFLIQSFENKTSTDIANSALIALLQLLGVDTTLITDNLPEILIGQYEDNIFQLNLSLKELNGALVVLSAAVPDSKLDNYTQLLKSLVDSSNIIGLESSIIEAQDTIAITESSESAKSDFLFVIDNSGSMSDEQAALAQAASDFAEAIAISDLDYSIAVITTDNPNPLTGSQITDTLVFSGLIETIGTSGSGNEQGVTMASLALQNSALGDAADGPLIAIGFPREEIGLNIIILTDESNSSLDIDPNDNLFIDRGYRWYSIYNSFDPGILAELAFATGGSVADIDVLDAFPAIMQNIAEDAGLSVNRIILSHTPIASTIQVKLNGVEVVNDADNGWSLANSSSGSSIVLRGNSKPTQGDQIEVTYKYIQ